MAPAQMHRPSIHGLWNDAVMKVQKVDFQRWLVEVVLGQCSRVTRKSDKKVRSTPDYLQGTAFDEATVPALLEVAAQNLRRATEQEERTVP